MERIILNQENHSVKEIYQDFYMFLAEHFTQLGYKYRKSKHDMYKNIENFRVVFDYQTFSWNCLGDEIAVFIHKRIEFKTFRSRGSYSGKIIVNLKNAKVIKRYFQTSQVAFFVSEQMVLAEIEKITPTLKKYYIPYTIN